MYFGLPLETRNISHTRRQIEVEARPMLRALRNLQHAQPPRLRHAQRFERDRQEAKIVRAGSDGDPYRTRRHVDGPRNRVATLRFVKIGRRAFDTCET
jgi:hypothetical protein